MVHETHFTKLDFSKASQTHLSPPVSFVLFTLVNGLAAVSVSSVIYLFIINESAAVSVSTYFVSSLLSDLNEIYDDF